MYPQKVLQGIPNRKGATDLSILNFLIMPKRQSEFIRHGLLWHPGGLSGTL